MKRTKRLSTLLLITGCITTGITHAQWLGPWGSENDLATAWGLEPSTLNDPDEGPGETIDYSNPEQPFGMNVQSGSQLNPKQTAPIRPARPVMPAPVAPAPAVRAPVARARPTPPPPPARPATPRAPRNYYQRPAPRNYGRYRQQARPMPYYAPRPLPPLRMPMPLSPYPYYRR